MKILVLVLASVLFFVNRAQADDDAANLTPIVVQASRSNDTVGEMNKDVTVITSEDIANSPAKTLPELLDDIPGVDARINSSVKDTQIDIGQFGESSFANVLILVDGERINKPDSSGADLSLVDLNTIDHIEIIQGAGTVLYGDNADGGVINIITKKGQENTKPSVTLTSEVDSYKGNKDGLAISGGIPKLTYQFDYDRQQSNNYRTSNDYWANDYDTRFNYNPTDIFGIDFAQGYHLDRYQLPGAISLGNYLNSSNNTVYGIDSVGRTGVNPSAIAYGTTSDSHFDITPHMKFDEGNSNIDLSLFTSARKSDANIVDPGSGYATNYETESYEFQPKLILTTPLTDRLDNKLTSGYDYIYYRENRRLNVPSNLEDIVNAAEASQGVYLLDELTLDDRWLLNTGVRGAWADYVFNETQQTPVKFERSPTTEGYDGGLGYKYNPDSKIFVDYTRTYRLPNLDEYFTDPYPGSPGNDNSAVFNSNGLSYQEGNQYQLGIKDQSFKDIHLGFTATEVQYKNEIYDDPVLGNANYNGRTRHISEEGDIAIDLLNKKISPFANITFQQTSFVSGQYSGKQIPDVPNQLAHAGIIFRPFEGLSTRISTDFTGKRYAIGDDQNLYAKVKRYDTVNLGATYDYKNMEIWFSLNNIFSTHYDEYGTAYGLDNLANFGSGSPEAYYPAPTRNIAAGVKVKF